MPRCDSVIPLLLHGITLEDIPKKNSQRVEGNDSKTGPDNIVVDLLYRKAQQEDAYAEFDEHHIDDVCDCCNCLPLDFVRYD